MKKFERKERTIEYMYYCEVPITMDQTSKWGFVSQEDAEVEGDQVDLRNIQSHNKGCWVKLAQTKEKNDKYGTFQVSHLVADVDGCPVGHKPAENGFVKRPVYAEQVTDEEVWMVTLDGPMSFPNPSKDGWMVYNEGSDDKPDLNDCYFLPNKDFQELYK